MKVFKKNIVFIILIPIIIISQILLLKPHLQYGFSDVDWWYLSLYKTQNPYSLSQFIDNLKVKGPGGGVYTHQIYYIGIQESLFGLNFKSFQQTTHNFKILATLFSYPIFLAISGSWAVAFVATILFGFSYAAAGTMYSVVTSSDYSAYFSMGLFFLVYGYIVKRNIGNWLWLLLALVLLMCTIFLSTERTYLVPLFILLTELFLYLLNKRNLQKNSIKRVMVLILPLFLISLTQPLVFLDFVLRNGLELWKRIIEGNWNLILTPFISLGSILIPSSLTQFSGYAKFANPLAFLGYLVSGPMPILIFFTIIIGIGVFRKPLIFIRETLLMMIFFMIFLYILSSNFIDHILTMISITQALVGMYIITVAIVSFRYWQSERKNILTGLFVGPSLAFIYIVLTWTGAATTEVFVGAHRYLTIPAMGVSFFIATLVVASFLRLFDLFKKLGALKIISFSPFILLFIFINMNINALQEFFNFQLYNGFGAADQQYMRSQLKSYLTGLSSKEPSLFYFDISEDNLNSYYYDNTIHGAFPTWMLWDKRINFNKELTPDYIWNQPQLLLEAVTTKEGKKGFALNGKFYDTDNFYAFKLKNRQVINIKGEVLKALGF